MAYTTATLTGTYLKTDGTPAEGTIEIIPNSSHLVDAEGDVILAGRVKVTLDGTGSFSVVLPATDDATIGPATGRQYTIVAKLRHTHLAAITGVELPGGTTVDVADVASLPVVDPTVTLAATPAQLAALEASVAEDLALKADTTDIPTTPAEVGAEPAGLSETTNAALAATYALKGETSGGGGVDRVTTPTVNGGTYTADLDTYDVFALTLTGDATLAVSGLVAGRSFVVEVQQDATGGHTLTLPSADGPTVTLDTTGNTYETLVYYSLDGTTLRVRQAGAGGGAAPAPAWSPQDMADKIAWFNAADLAGTDGSAISSWSNSFTGGVASAATQATGTLQPVVQTVNGVKVARFTSDRLTTAAFTSEAQPFTFAMLVKLNDAGGGTFRSLLYGASASEVGLYIANSTDIYTVFTGAANATTQAETYTGGFRTIVVTFNGASTKFRYDGTEQTLSGAAGAAALTALNIGTNYAGSHPIDGDVAEIIAVGHAVTGDELTDLETYLNAKKADLAA